MPLAVYPGCSLTGSSREYMESVEQILKTFEIPYTFVEDWNCCGATAAHNLNRKVAEALPARIIALAEKQGADEILVPCAACYNRLKSSQKKMDEDKVLKGQLSEMVGMPLDNGIKILNVLEVIEQSIVPKLNEKIQAPLNFKAACYYGCLLVRPGNVLNFDREEDPQSMDRIVEILGATPVKWSFKTECCGAGFTVSRTDIVSRLSGDILIDAVEHGAQALIVACPMCHANLDMRRKDIEKATGRKFDIPVIYLTQAIGMALGIDHQKLGLNRHFVPVSI